MLLLVANPTVSMSVEAGLVTMAITFSGPTAAKMQRERKRERGMSGSQRSTLKQRATQMDLGPQG